MDDIAKTVMEIWQNGGATLLAATAYVGAGLGMIYGLVRLNNHMDRKYLESEGITEINGVPLNQVKYPRIAATSHRESKGEGQRSLVGMRYP
ncbi:hypothetical protein ACFL6I_23345 [candidate division KSB1 bacterium]